MGACAMKGKYYMKIEKSFIARHGGRIQILIDRYPPRCSLVGLPVTHTDTLSPIPIQSSYQDPTSIQENVKPNQMAKIGSFNLTPESSNISSNVEEIKQIDTNVENTRKLQAISDVDQIVEELEDDIKYEIEKDGGKLQDTVGGVGETKEKLEDKLVKETHKTVEYAKKIDESLSSTLNDISTTSKSVFNSIFREEGYGQNNSANSDFRLTHSYKIVYSFALVLCTMGANLMLFATSL